MGIAVVKTALGVLAVLLLVSSASWATAPSPGPSAPVSSGFLTEFRSHIQHIVIVMMENHPYDNMFGDYCLAVGPYCPDNGTGYPSGLCVPLYPGNSTGPCAKPFPFTQANDTLPFDIIHDYNSTIAAYDNGSMDGFYLAENRGLDPFGYYNGSTNPIYWDMAEEYGLSDHFFSAYPSYSLPNHWYLVAGQAPAAIHWQKIGPHLPPYIHANLTAYLKEANQTPSLEALLVNHSTTWKYYDAPLFPTYQKAVKAVITPFGNAGAYAYWDPLAAQEASYTAANRTHFVNNTRFFANAAAGRLPQVSIVIPHANESDHPLYSHDLAQEWAASVVDAVEGSPDWNSTAIFLTWDEYGGFYDHAAPPTRNGQMLGFRVPLLVISPYTPVGVIGSGLGDFESLLHLTEQRFLHGQCFTAMDCQAPMPFAPFFNFSMSPRAPMLFPTNINLSSYPMPPQQFGAGAPPGFGASSGFSPPEEFLSYSPSELGDVD